MKPFISQYEYFNISLLASTLNAIRIGSFSTYVAEMALAVLATMAHTERKRERERERVSEREWRVSFTYSKEHTLQYNPIYTT